MGLRLVDDDLDISLDLELGEFVLSAIRVQLQRSAWSEGGSNFEMRLAQKLPDLLDTDLQPPTASQLSYAIAISKSLGVSLPGDALLFKGSMCEFLGRHAPLFQERHGIGKGSAHE